MSPNQPTSSAAPTPFRALARRWSTAAGTRLGGQRLAVGLLLLVVPVAVVGFWGQKGIDREIKLLLRKELEATLAAAQATTQLWLSANQRALVAALADPRVLQLVRCMAEERDSGCVGQWREVVKPYTAATGAELWVVTRTGAARTYPAVGRTQGEAEDLAMHLRAVGLRGNEPTYIPPFMTGDRPEVGGFVGALEREPDGPLVYLTVAPTGLQQVLTAARAGESGECYAVDATGRMLTNTRFLSDLRFAGLLGPNDTSSVLTVEVRDPGVNLKGGERTGVLRADQPLTRMALGLSHGESGVDVDGYRDYRGVSVVGAWAWLPEFSLGLAFELDKDEALAASQVLRLQYLALLSALGLVTVGTAVASWFAIRLRARATRELARSEELGQYRLERELGRGGMGTVYLARHAVLKRPTAVKVIRPERNSREALARFEREARATSELTHPNTVAIYDFGASKDGSFFYAMEYLEGLDLEALVERHGKLPEARLVHLLLQACGSLAEAHSRQLVHRDIKPSNLFICDRGLQGDVLKVLDFGIVKESVVAQSHITRESTVIGTPEYMSPEMFDRAHAVGPQTDIYSLGAAAYFALTGRPVFEAVSLAQLCTAHLMETPVRPSERIGVDFDRSLEDIILGCLAKSPGSRPSGAEELRRFLLQLPYAQEWTVEAARAFWSKASIEEQGVRGGRSPGFEVGATSSRC